MLDFTKKSSERLPRTAYIALWLPKPSETFVLSEVKALWESGLPLRVFALYGPWKRHLSPSMRVFSSQVEHMGLKCLPWLAGSAFYWLHKNPRRVMKLFHEIAWRKWRDLEQLGENLWAFFAGFYLARRFRTIGIEHIHAVWANGPATAAWVAHRLSGIPFSFTCRAGDIFPPDGALREKIKACTFVRTENKTNLGHLSQFTDYADSKIRVVYSVLNLNKPPSAPVQMNPPFRLLAVGRFVKKKGFDVLLKACHLLNLRGVPFRMALAGSGPEKSRLLKLCRKYGLDSKVDFLGFLTHDQVLKTMRGADILIMPSVLGKNGDRDGIPTVLMEALSQRLPVIASRISGIGEIIEHGQTGLLVPPQNPRVLAAAIEIMAFDRSKALQMAERGRKLVSNMFDRTRNAGQMLDLFLTKGKTKHLT